MYSIGTIVLKGVLIPIPAQGAYQSHFKWALIKTLISWFLNFLKVKICYFWEENHWKISPKKCYPKPRSDDTQDGGCNFEKTLQVAICLNFNEKESILRGNRWKKDALVINSADYGYRRSLFAQRWVNEIINIAIFTAVNSSTYGILNWKWRRWAIIGAWAGNGMNTVPPFLLLKLWF